MSSIGVAFASDVYVAGSVGQSNFGSADGATSSDKNDTAFKLQLGYQFTPNLAIEGGYIDLGKASYNFLGTTLQVKANGWNIGAVGTLPLNEKFSLIGKLGMIDGKLEATAGRFGSASATKFRPTYGLGVKYDVSKSAAVLAEYEHFDKLSNDMINAKVNLLSAGFLTKF